ncbi:unnamed protein product [Chilo suppressalis]|uniref:Non-structural maintenance of chromosomes element 4 n=1 Tax=Chilo suppressalis TaxID=168631 RepID=A0ABN8B6G4_CHISP|nr:hypothetical protein evm_006321 [Chilo suppressalis]CAH0403892.1 unnamed protein product [Chilo suppressalis]
MTSRGSLGSHDRKLRYRALLDNLSTLEDENDNNVQRMDKTANAVREAQSLLAEGGVEERVKHPGEGYLDSRVLKATSDLAVRCSEAVSGNANTYDKHELAQHIRENPSFWSFPPPLCVPPSWYMFGTFAPTPPEQRVRAPRARAERQQAAALKAPDNVDKLEKVEEGSEMVTRVNRFIQKSYRTSTKPLSYFHLVLDPDSFARTVENIYNVSFLVRDGMLAVQLDEEFGLPFVTPLAGSDAGGGDITEENQFIVSIDIQRWQELIEAFDIKKPMMVLKRS